jgi:phospholipid/cholesterol/gamma-HCH transport system substrate-binding protein
MRTISARVAVGVTAALLMSSCAALGFETACNGTEIIGKFEQVGDLVENANVQSSDVRVGTIKKIELDGWEAQVTMCLNPGEKIPDDVIAVVRTTSLLGEKFVDLQTQSEGGPFLEDGAILESDQTSKATELEEIFAKLAGVLGTGNLEQINRFTSSQAKILSDHADELRDVLLDLRDFTDLLADRKSEIAGAVDHLDSVAATLIQQTPVLQRFLRSFAESSGVLADNKNGLRTLLFSLDRFTKISVQLLAATDNGLNKQFQDLRPVLDTLVANSANLRKTLTTLAAFSRYWPESMPGDYLQLDVCLAGAEDFDAGDNCPQSDGGGVGSAGSSTEELPANGTEMILMRPLAGGR